jgi:hypothetical protein
VYYQDFWLSMTTAAVAADRLFFDRNGRKIKILRRRAKDFRVLEGLCGLNGRSAA